jgi:putative acetyltransferase
MATGKLELGDDGERELALLVIGEYRRADAGALMRLFHDTVHSTCSTDYTPEQLAAWSPASGLDVEAWRARFDAKKPFVASVGLEPIGFIELEADGHIDCLYVHRDFQRRGVATRLLEHAVARARARSMRRLYVEASITAVPFFVRHHFSVVRSQEVERRGQWLKNFVMERLLEREPPA